MNLFAVISLDLFGRAGHEWRAARLFSETVGSEGSHDDFKAQTKDVASASDVFETIKSDISTNQVFVYMKVRA